MRRNFEFEHFSVIRWQDTFIELDNAYDLSGFGTNLTGTEATLDFIRNEHAFAPDKLPAKVTLRCTGNVRLAFSNLGAIAAPLDDEGIQIAYFDDGCDWSSFLDEEIAKRQEPLGLHISFINGFTARIFCDETTLETHPN
ncbi:MAG TPA: hypothetical protein VM308_07475 [Sphingomicrobium sp.]|nr:hypothetical protein [Sphingomicrobium sp.]